ncbi:MAG: hypothetical protein ACE5FY_04085 [Nitrospiria bacterium]
MIQSQRINILLFSFLIASPIFNRPAEAVVNTARLEAAGREITELIVLLSVIAATIGILMGAIKIRKGQHTEGKDVITGSCVCLFVASTLYMIISLVSG